MPSSAPAPSGADELTFYDEHTITAYQECVMARAKLLMAYVAGILFILGVPGFVLSVKFANEHPYGWSGYIGVLCIILSIATLLASYMAVIWRRRLGGYWRSETIVHEQVGKLLKDKRIPQVARDRISTAHRLRPSMDIIRLSYIFDPVVGIERPSGGVDYFGVYTRRRVIDPKEYIARHSRKSRR